MPRYLSTGSAVAVGERESRRAAAALKCSMFLPKRSSLRVRANCCLMASKGAMEDCGLLVR